MTAQVFPVAVLAGDAASADDRERVLNSAKAASVGLPPEPDRIISDEEWELVQAYRGVESARMRHSFKN